MNSIFDGKLRVLDLSMGWAGPLVGQMFAEMGAEVIKVEDTHHFDWWRGSLSMAPPEMQPIERAAVFNTANRGKRGVTLDLASARGIEILKRLIKVSDILIENYSPGVMDRLGLGYDAVRAINPRLIMISMPSFGSDGPECNARGYGNTVEAMAGVTGLTGYHDGDGQRYTLSNALGDPVGGLHGVFALMVALRERERTGRGELIELAQVESLIPFVTEAILDFQFMGRVPAPRGNRHREHAPHGIYRCAGDDNWVALACETDEQWHRLAGELGIDDKRFATASERKANEDALDAELSRALCSMNADDCVARFSDADVLVAPVNSAPAVMADPQIQSREYFAAIDRAVVGTHLYPGAVARIPDTPLRADTAAPLLGEHNRQVFAGMLGMTDDEIAELERDGVIGSTPRAQSGELTGRSLEKSRLFVNVLTKTFHVKRFLVQENETRTFAMRSVQIVFGDEAVHAFERAVEDFDLRALIVLVDDSHGGVVVDLLGSEAFAEASDHSADDTTLFFQVGQLDEGVFVGIDGDGAFAVVRDQLMTASGYGYHTSNHSCADDDRRNSHREFSCIAPSSTRSGNTAIPAMISFKNLHRVAKSRKLRGIPARDRVDDSRLVDQNPMRIGLISDTHIPEACEHLPPRVFEVFAGIDLVMHAGDVYVNRVLDELSAIAPVIAALGNGDEGLDGHRHRLEADDRVREAHLVEIAGVRIGLVHSIPTPDETSEEVFARAMDTQFGGPVDVVVQGHSHVEGVTRFGATMVVNPGSATLPRNLIGVPGTVAILEIGNGGEVSAEIISLG